MKDTIAAVATALGNSGIGIIRVSGEKSIEIVDQVFRDKKNQAILNKMKSHTIRYGYIIDEKNEIVDEVMVSLMKNPHSFTTENTVEINCHGGMLVMNRILELVLAKGARAAQPGEFTKRAFLNGRIDLSEAEAVMDVISSSNEMALKSSLRQLKGSVSNKIKELREVILHESAFIEAALDDPEHFSLEGYKEELISKLEILMNRISILLDTFENGRMIKEGINTVIIGKPNVGKSSLLNILTGEEKAIVTEIAGTTRDILEENINLNGIELHIMDTAGIRSTEDIVEKIGVERAIKYANDADLIIYIVDSSVPLDANDKNIIELVKNHKCIVLFNKSDLDQKISIEELTEQIGQPITIIKTSTKEHTGINEFEQAVRNMFFSGNIFNNEELLITNLRHKEALQETLDSLTQVKNSIELDMPEDFYSIDLMDAYKSLGKIIGEEVEEDLVNEIFFKFCMGK